MKINYTAKKEKKNKIKHVKKKNYYHKKFIYEKIKGEKIQIKREYESEIN